MKSFRFQLQILEKIKKQIVLLLLFVGLSLLLASHLESNIAFVLINKGLSQQQPLLSSYVHFLLDAATKLNPDNSSAYRGLSYVHYNNRNFSDAGMYWVKSALAADDLVVMGDLHLSQNRFEEALAWYETASPFISESNLIWVRIGQSCQKGLWERSICQEFLRKNKMNYLVNTDFSEDRRAWSAVYQDIADHSIERCPERLDMCARIETTHGDLERYPSWVQCLNLPVNLTYRFSAWLRVQGDPGVKWRPMYYQGELDGATKGYWPGTEQGNIEWVYWEQEFILPPFEEGQVCFHPVRLESMGTAWFYDARLALVQTETP